MKYVWSYVNGIERDAYGVFNAVWSEEREIPYDIKQLSKMYFEVGTYRFSDFTVVLYSRHGITPPKTGWKDLAYTLGMWHFDSI